MAEPGLETYANHTNSSTASSAADETGRAQRDGTLFRSLLFVGIAAASASLAYVIVRASLTRAPADPTTERIQKLIDEANRLLKALDDKKPD